MAKDKIVIFKKRKAISALATFHAVYLFWWNWNLEVLVFWRVKNRRTWGNWTNGASGESWHKVGIKPRPQQPVPGSRSVETIRTSERATSGRRAGDERATSGINHELTSPFLSQTPLVSRPLLRSFPLTESLEQTRATMVGGERSQHCAIPASWHESQGKVK